MSFDIVLATDEELLFCQVLAPITKHSDPFALAVSNQALYLAKKKTFAVSDPHYFSRIPLSKVRGVSVHRHRPVWLLILAPLLVLLGVLFIILFFQHPTEDTFLQLFRSAIMIIAGLSVPFLAGKRRALSVHLVSETFRWLPRLTINETNSKRALQFLQDFTAAARRAGIRVVDDLNRPAA